MDTIYYTLNTRRVKVCGGPDLVRFLPATGSQDPREGKGKGEILDLELCRKRLETKKAWRELHQAVDDAPASVEEEEEGMPTPPSAVRRERGASWLELGASAAVILAGLSAAAAFLSVL